MNCLRRLEMSRWVPDRNVARVGERALRGALQPRRARPLPYAPAVQLRPLFSECAVRRARHVDGSVWK
jgi:hypothetical protein